MHGIPFNKYSDKQFLKSQLRMHKITAKQILKNAEFFFWSTSQPFHLTKLHTHMLYWLIPKDNIYYVLHATRSQELVLPSSLHHCG